MTTTQQKATSLQTQILAVNCLYRHSKEIIEKEMAFLTPLIGKDVFKVDGSFKAKYEHDTNGYNYKVNSYGFDFWVNTHYYFKVAYNKLTLEVVTTVSGGGYDKNGVNCNHSQQKQGFDLFNVDNGKLVSIYESNLSHLDNVYTEADILDAAKEVAEAAKQYESALSKVPNRFRDTLYLQRLR